MNINNSGISRVEISETLSKLKALASQTKAPAAQSASEAPGFNQLLSLAKDSIADINTSQLQTEALSSSYLAGNPQVSMSQVMVSSMKSKLAFEGLLVVRNKLLESYKEIMNMPV
jgi:flagellar hook-basal body complex protein FliE